jgi:hypothetical protein
VSTEHLSDKRLHKMKAVIVQGIAAGFQRGAFPGQKKPGISRATKGVQEVERKREAWNLLADAVGAYVVGTVRGQTVGTDVISAISGLAISAYVVSAVRGQAVGTDVISAISGLAISTDVVSAVRGQTVGTDVISAISGLAISADVVSAVRGQTVGTDVISAISGLAISAYVVSAVRGQTVGTDMVSAIRSLTIRTGVRGIRVRRTAFRNNSAVQYCRVIGNRQSKCARCQDRETKTKNKI